MSYGSRDCHADTQAHRASALQLKFWMLYSSQGGGSDNKFNPSVAKGSALVRVRTNQRKEELVARQPNLPCRYANTRGKHTLDGLAQAH